LGRFTTDIGVANRLQNARDHPCQFDMLMFGWWHFGDIATSQVDFRFRWKSGHAADITPMTEFDRYC
jgi:hypothetical protein